MNKKALLVGINYIGTPNQLGGCINDVLNVQEILLTEYGYKAENILLLTDNTTYKPSKANIISGFAWLLTADSNSNFNPANYSTRSAVATGQHNYFHYSGHGTRVSSHWQNHDAICPLDFANSGMMSDGEISSYLTHRVPPNSDLNATIDACHSANCFDLDWTCKPFNLGLGYSLQQISNFPPTNAPVMMLSGCQDNQTSSDLVTNNYEGIRQDQGALTCTLLKVLQENKYNISCEQLLYKVCNDIKVLSQQIPAMTFGQKINIDSPYSM